MLEANFAQVLISEKYIFVFLFPHQELWEMIADSLLNQPRGRLHQNDGTLEACLTANSESYRDIHDLRPQTGDSVPGTWKAV